MIDHLNNSIAGDNMINSNSDEPPAGFVQTEDSLRKATAQKKQSEYKDMQIELQGGKRHTKYKWNWDKLK